MILTVFLLFFFLSTLNKEIIIIIPGEPFSHSTSASTCELHYMERGGLTRDSLSNLVESVLTQVMT